MCRRSGRVLCTGDSKVPETNLRESKSDTVARAPVLKTTTEVQDALLLSRRRAKKKFGDEEKNGVARKNFRGFHCVPIENTPKTAREAKKKNTIFFREKNARAAREEKKSGVHQLFWDLVFNTDR